MNAATATKPEFTILIDGLCPLCRHEGRLLEKLDRGRGRLSVVDITDEGFDPEAMGIAYDSAMGQIHGVTGDGRVVTGMEVFRRAYAATGWGWLWAPTGWPILRPLFDAAYRWFAKHRLTLTGRKADDCADGRCAVDR